MELIVVIGVLAILMTILIPQLTGYTDKAKAVAARADGRTALTAASAYAISMDTGGKTFAAADMGIAILDSLGVKDAAEAKSKGLYVTATGKNAATVIKKDGDLVFINTIDPAKGTFKLECIEGKDSKRCEKLNASGSVDGISTAAIPA
ncbi:MAG: hypothetical protein RR802_06305, partial [Erysipelotrichaceae bacterium]